MGLIERLLALVLGGGFRDTVELFRENAESGAARDAARSDAALRQFAAEFGAARPGLFDRVMDGLNRLPRPALALGTLGLFVSAMVDPVWFASRMQGIALVPEPLWWLMGAIVSFYFRALPGQGAGVPPFDRRDAGRRARGRAEPARAPGARHGRGRRRSRDRCRRRPRGLRARGQPRARGLEARQWAVT